MANASAGWTLTVNTDTKAITLSDRLALYESRKVTVSTASGDTWPAGDYTLALTYAGRNMGSVVLTYNSGALSGTLNLNTTELAAVFAILARKRIALDLTLWDDSNHIAWGRGKVDVYYTEFTEATPSATVEVADYYTGSTSITNGADSVTVNLSSLSLTSTPAQIVCTVKAPSGGYNLFATVTASSSTAFTATLSAATEQENYVLNWVIYT